MEVGSAIASEEASVWAGGFVADGGRLLLVEVGELRRARREEWMWERERVALEMTA